MVKTISELIKLLQEVSAEHGDLEVKLLNRNDDNPMRGLTYDDLVHPMIFDDRTKGKVCALGTY